MIEDLYEKLDPQEAKKISNIMIGKFESPISTTKNLKFNKMCNEKEADTFEGYKKEIYGKYILCYDEKDTFNIYNKKPISIQIKDESRKMLYEMMKDLNLENEDIKQVKTDSIGRELGVVVKGVCVFGLGPSLAVGSTRAGQGEMSKG